MKTYKINFRLKGSAITPFQSDTIWGHFAWACFYIWGEKFGREFIKANKNGNPTLVTNAYPDGYIPVPLVEIKYIGDEDSQLFKEIKKRKIMKIENFRKIKDNLSWDSVFNILKTEVTDSARSGGISKFTVMRNKIDRLTFTTSGEGELFATDEVFYDPEFKMWFAVRTDFLNREQIEKILKHIELSGFGADSSIGRGRLEFISIEEDYEFPESDNANAFVSLSNFIPTQEDLNNSEDMWYSIFTKYPKVGGHFALSDPFKKPLVFMEAGSVFKVKQVKNFYGRVIENVHSNSEVVQYAYAFPLKVRLEG
ncbi:MAG: hypothetical protein ABDI07_09415 [Candidatus Kryptonium sp.]